MDQLTLSYSTDEDCVESLFNPVDNDDLLTTLHVKPLPSRRNTGGVVNVNQESWLWWLSDKCIIL